jgi:glycosyltransferase involved in cell wall biosynthesis
MGTNDARALGKSYSCVNHWGAQGSAYASPRPTSSKQTRRVKPLYHQLLVSPRIGGAEKLAVELHKYISSKRAGTSRLLVPAAGETKNLAISEHLPFDTYNWDSLMAPRRLPSLIENLHLCVMMGTFRRGIIHIHSPFVYGALRPFLALSGLKTILHVHLDYAEEQLIWSLKSPPDLVVVCGDFIRERVQNLLRSGSAKRTKVAVIVNGVDTKRFFPANRRKAKQDLGVDPDRPLILLTANLARHKGHETAIRSLAMLIDKGYRPLLWLVGEQRDSRDDYAEYLKELAKDLNVSEFVEFLGFRNDVPELIHAADFLLLPSTQEGLPLVILEAQASKVIVLAAPTAGIPEVIKNGRTGFLIPADDFEAYAQRLIMLIEHVDVANVVAETAFRQITSTFSFTHYCEKLLAQYDCLLEQGCH